jgi:hypothetical protein
MPDYPLLRAFIGELGGLAPEDLELPLPILVRVCRARLRAPLETVARISDVGLKNRRGIQATEAILDARWPSLGKGASLHAEGNVSIITQGALANAEWYAKQIIDMPLLRGAIFDINKPLLVAGTTRAWHSYSMAWLMCELTLEPTDVEVFGIALEEALALNPMIGQAMLQLADLSMEDAEQLDLTQAKALAAAEQREQRRQQRRWLRWWRGRGRREAVSS